MQKEGAVAAKELSPEVRCFVLIICSVVASRFEESVRGLVGERRRGEGRVY
jgi:hypothetical protein